MGFTYSLDKHWLNFYYVPGTALNAMNIKINMTCSWPKTAHSNKLLQQNDLKVIIEVCTNGCAMRTQHSWLWKKEQ